MPVQTHVSEMIGTFPRLPYLHALQLVNRAWSRVRDCRLWSWQLVMNAQLFAPAMIMTGSVNVTQLQTVITVDATAAAAINAASIMPPLAGPLGFGRQIRVNNGAGTTANTGATYNILAWDGVSVLTIDRPFAEGTYTNSPYQIFKSYYTPPALPFTSIPGADPAFIRFLTVANRTSGYTITGRRLHWTQEQLDRADPTHSSCGDPSIIAACQPNALGQPIFELYPTPANQAVYACCYYTRWPDVSNTQDFPQVPYGLVPCVLDLARYFACQWAASNAATFPELQQTNWVAQMASYKQDHAEGLRLCLKMDDEIMPQLPIYGQRQVFRDMPLDGAFLQNHDLSGLLN